jgi:halogenation protein CepH
VADSTPKARYDAVVIGGGPGGSCAAAFLARAGHDVAVFEKDKFPRHRIGESLLPATTMGVMKKLGAMELIENAGFTRKYGGTFLWGSSDKPWTFNFYRTSEADRTVGDHPEFLHSFQVERSVFDKLLLDYARTQGVDVFEESRFLGIDDIGAEMKSLRVESQGERETVVQAPFVIDAGGRNSLLRTKFGERHYDPFFKNVALYGYWKGGKRMEGEKWGNILTVAFEHGWFWYIPLDRELTSVGLVLGREKFNEMKDKDQAEIYRAMIDSAPMIKDYLATAEPCTRAPYDQLRVDIDYSYAHSTFTHQGNFLVGDAACFIDPVFSSGVHLATYSAFLAATAIDRTIKKEQTLAEASAEYESLYRREYMVFYRFLSSFYQIHADSDSYFWAARKVLGRESGSDMDAFISLISGQSTAGDTIFGSPAAFESQIGQGARSLHTLIDRVSPGTPTPSDADVSAAREFMMPLHESRRRLLTED